MAANLYYVRVRPLFMLATFADDKKQIKLFLKDSLEVRLPESQVSGYLWRLDEKCCPCLRFFESIYVERGPARFNGLGERSWFFVAATTGECELTFCLLRPWSRLSPEFRMKIFIDFPPPLDIE
jgi:inhibitor of cysteine peptidase